MSSKEQAISQIVALAEAHDITVSELTSALGKREIEANKKDAFTLTRVFSYLGGIFILSGLCAYIGLSWQHLNSAARIIITLGPGIACLIMAVTVAMQPARKKSLTALVILSAALQSTGLFVAVYEFSTGGGDIRLAALAIFGVLAAQYGILFTKVRRTSFLFFTIYFAYTAFINLCNVLRIPENPVEFTFGASLLALSYGLQRTRYNAICGFGYFVSSIALLWVGFDFVSGSRLEITYLAVASFMLYVGTLVGSRSVLITSALALFSYISYFTSKHFMDSLGWPLCLIALGGVFFAISNLALKLDRKLAAQKA